MSWFKPTTLLDKAYELGLLLKGASAALELIGAILLVLVPKHTAVSVVLRLTQNELLTDPHDLAAHTLFDATQSLWGTAHNFTIAYLLVHAVIKLIIVIGLLRNVRWAFPFSFVTLCLMIMYQLYEIAIRPGPGMVALTVFDLFILWLIRREYQKFRLHLVQSDEVAAV